MRYTLARSQVHRHAAHLLRTHLRRTDSRSRCPARVLRDVLLAAAAWLTSLSAACLRLPRAPCPETAGRSGAAAGAAAAADDADVAVACGPATRRRL